MFSEFSPCIESILNIARSDQSQDTKLARLARAVLRSAGNGDTDLLAWFLDTRVRAMRSQPPSDGPAEAHLFAALDLRAIRDDSGGMGPVSLAASAGHVDTVRLLVDYGADIDERDGAGWTPLMWAINSSNLALVSFLVKRGADVEARSHQGTSCEDFIVSVAPNDSNEAGPSTFHRRDAINSPWSSDHELIADLIFDQLQLAAATQHSTSTQHHSLATSPSASSPSSRPSTPHDNRHARSSSASLHSPLPGITSPATSRGGVHPRTLSHQASSGHLTTSSTSRRLVGRTERAFRQEADLKAREIAQGRRKALLDIAVLLEVKYADLIGYAPDLAEDNDDPRKTAKSSWAVKRGKARRRGAGRKSVSAQAANPTDLSAGCGAREVGSDPLSVEFEFDHILPHQMLVVGEDDVDPLLEVFVSRAHPVRAPWTTRAEPANIIFLAMRFAARFGDEDLLINLLYGALERIEEQVREHESSMTHLAFWLFNLTLLLHYIFRDPNLAHFPKMQDEYLPFVADLINETYVTVIRDIERRINRILEPAMLEHEAIPGFEDVRFEGEWKFIKTLTGSVKSSFGAASPNVGSVSKGSPAAGTPTRRPLSQIFARKDNDLQQGPPAGEHRDKVLGSGSPALTAGSHTPARASPRLGEHLSPGFNNTQLKEASYDATAAELLSNPCPRTVTSLLTSALHVLQLYEINPATIIQALSQVFYWIGSESFNKVLSNKRYLCRSKAMQLKLNVSALEDWARSNALPLSIVNTHLAPLNQLISWLACQSSLQEFDSLIATMQGLRCLNPLQMRKAVRDYRYEVGEGRMSEECLQYLDQFQVDWGRSQEALLEAQEEERARRELEAMRREILRQDREAAEDARAAAADASTSTDAITPRVENGPRLGDDLDDVQRKKSQHHRSGTATQDGPTPDSRSPSPSSMGQSEDKNAANESFATDTSGTVAEQGRKNSVQMDFDEKTPEGQALAAQSAIDSLFLPGRSMSDYTPPIAPEASKEAPISQQDSLVSSVMLPFALPSRVEALVVSPGDAFGFGRGHFTGTGTAALRQMRPANALMQSRSAAGSSAAGSHSGSPFPPGTPRMSEIDLDMSYSDDGGDAQSRTSGLSAASTNTSSTTSNVFASGKGFAAGGYWQPVPLLSDETFERITDTMRYVQKRRESMFQRRVMAGRVVNGWTSAGGGMMSPRSPSILVQSPLAGSEGAGQLLPPWSHDSASPSLGGRAELLSPVLPSVGLASPGKASTDMKPGSSSSAASPPLILSRPGSPTKPSSSPVAGATPQNTRKASGFSARAPALNLPPKNRGVKADDIDESVEEEEEAGEKSNTMGLGIGEK